MQLQLRFTELEMQVFLQAMEWLTIEKGPNEQGHFIPAQYNDMMRAAVLPALTLRENSITGAETDKSLMVGSRIHHKLMRVTEGEAQAIHDLFKRTPYARSINSMLVSCLIIPHAKEILRRGMATGWRPSATGLPCDPIIDPNSFVPNEEVVCQCLSEMEYTLNRMGTLAFDEKGPGQLMDLKALTNEIRELPPQEAAITLKAIYDLPARENRSRHVAAEIVSRLKDWNDLMEQEGVVPMLESLIAAEDPRISRKPTH